MGREKGEQSVVSRCERTVGGFAQAVCRKSEKMNISGSYHVEECMRVSDN